MKHFKKIIALVMAAALMLSSLLTVSFLTAAANSPVVDPASLNMQLDFMNARATAPNGVYKWHNVEYTPTGGYENALYATDADDNYLLFKTLADTPVVANFRIHYDSLGTGVSSPKFYGAASENGPWESLTATKAVSGDKAVFTVAGIGEKNTYLRMEFCYVSGWQYCMEAISFNATDKTIDAATLTSGLSENGTDDLSFLQPHGLYASTGNQYVANNGALTVLADSTMVFKVAANSAFVADINRGGADVSFDVSADGTTWTRIEDVRLLSGVMDGYGRGTYYIPAIGAENLFVRVNVFNTSGWNACVRFLEFRFAAYNAAAAPVDPPFVAPATDTALDFVNDYDNALDKAYDKKGDLEHNYTGGIGGVAGKDAYVVYKVEKDSPIVAAFKMFPEETAGRPAFYASADGESWSGALAYRVDSPITTQGMYKLVVDSIGEGCRYVKVVFSDTALTAAYHMDMYSLSFNANTETEQPEQPEQPDDGDGGDTFVVPTTDTKLDFVNDYANALGKAHAQKGTHDIWQGGVGGTGGEDAYVTYIVEKNSPIVATFKMFPEETNGRPVFYGSADGKTWERLTYQTNVPITTQAVYTLVVNSVGAENRYVKVVFSDRAVPAVYHMDMQSLAFNANTESDLPEAPEDGDQGSDGNQGGGDQGNGDQGGSGDQGGEDQDGQVTIPTTDTTLDFVNKYGEAVEKGYAYSGAIQIYAGGIGGAGGEDVYIIYKVQKNSPIVADFKMFPGSTQGRPVLYASADAKTWEKLTYKTDAPIAEQRNYNLIVDGIGEDNCYIKVVFSDQVLEAMYFMDMQSLSFNANTDPLPYDLTLNFVNDAAALGRLYAFTPPEAFEQVNGQGLMLTVDYLSGQSNQKKPRLIMNVDSKSGIKAEFRVSEYAEALGLLPTVYASKDGAAWVAVDEVELTRLGTTDGYTNYRLFMDPLDTDYSFLALEYPQDKDYTGTEVEELDDIVPDCQNAGIILTSLSFLQPAQEAEKPLPGDENEAVPGDKDEIIAGGEDAGASDDDYMDGESVPTGDTGVVLLVVLSALSVICLAVIGAVRVKTCRRG